MKHSVLATLVVLSFGCSSISVERFFEDGDKQLQDKKAPKLSEDTKQIQPTNAPKVSKSSHSDEISSDKIKSNVVQANKGGTFVQVESMKIDSACPKQFHNLQIPENGKYCQSFAAELPASLVFFVPMQPSETVKFLVDKNQNFNIKQQVKNRVMLSNSDNSKTLIVSPDGVGSQVDILVKR